MKPRLLRWEGSATIIAFFDGTHTTCSDVSMVWAELQKVKSVGVCLSEAEGRPFPDLLLSLSASLLAMEFLTAPKLLRVCLADNAMSLANEYKSMWGTGPAGSCDCHVGGMITTKVAKAMERRMRAALASGDGRGKSHLSREALML